MRGGGQKLGGRIAQSNVHLKKKEFQDGDDSTFIVEDGMKLNTEYILPAREITLRIMADEDHEEMKAHSSTSSWSYKLGVRDAETPEDSDVNSPTRRPPRDCILNMKD